VAILIFFRLASALALKFILYVLYLHMLIYIYIVIYKNRFRPTAMSGKTAGNKPPKRLRHMKKSLSVNELKIDIHELKRPQITISLQNINLFVKKYEFTNK
jgi:DNA-binding transcriptional regulator of glucitol operon